MGSSLASKLANWQLSFKKPFHRIGSFCPLEVIVFVNYIVILIPIKVIYASVPNVFVTVVPRSKDLLKKT